MNFGNTPILYRISEHPNSVSVILIKLHEAYSLSVMFLAPVAFPQDVSDVAKVKVIAPTNSLRICWCNQWS